MPARPDASSTVCRANSRRHITAAHTALVETFAVGSAWICCMEGREGKGQYG